MGCINVIVLCLGLVVMGTGGAVMHFHNKFDVVLTDTHYAVPLQTMATAIFLVLHGCLRCITAIKNSPCMLTLYTVVVGLVLVAVLTTTVILLLFTKNATNFVTDSMTDAYQQYGAEGKMEITHALDVLQHEGQCCGIDGYEDWANFPYRNGTSVADGCCKDWSAGCGVDMLNKTNVAKLVWSDGCFDYVYDFYVVLCIGLVILSFVLFGFQVLSIAWACFRSSAEPEYLRIEGGNMQNFSTACLPACPSTGSALWER